MRGFQVIPPRPPNGPDLAPCAFRLFPWLEELLKGIQFNSDEEIKAEVTRRSNVQTQEFNLDVISQLVKRWRKCIALEGSCVEKQLCLNKD